MKLGSCDAYEVVAGIEGCEGKVIKFLFRDGNFLPHILIVEANFLVAESEMTEFIKPLDEPYGFGTEYLITFT